MCMALFSNYPFALAPGMGLNAYFAYTLVLQEGYSWQLALAAVFVEGIIFIILTLTNVREAIFNSMPKTLKLATTIGIGFFVSFIGLQNAKIIVNNEATLVSIGNLTDVSPALALIGIIVTIVLLSKKIWGALLLGILITWSLGIVLQLFGIYVVNPEIGNYSLIPSAVVSLPPSLEPIAFKLSFAEMGSILDFFVIVFALLFVDLFDTLGTLIGVSQKVGYLDKDGKLPKIKKVLLSDAIATTVGALLGTSTVTTFVESSSGALEGGRTGLTSMTTALLFLLALFFTPIITVIPTFATAPALIVVGILMVENVVEINFTDLTEGFPAFMTILIMLTSYSISEGIVFGIVSYVLLKLFCNRKRDLNPVIITIGVLFLLKIILD